MTFHVKSHLWQFWKNLLGRKMYLPVSYAARRYWFKDQERQTQCCWHFLKGHMQNASLSESERVSKIIFWFPSLLVCKTIRGPGTAWQRFPPPHLHTLSSWTLENSALKPNLFSLVHTAELMGFPKCHSKQREAETLGDKRICSACFSFAFVMV